MITDGIENGIKVGITFVVAIIFVLGFFAIIWLLFGDSIIDFGVKVFDALMNKMIGYAGKIITVDFPKLA